MVCLLRVGFVLLVGMRLVERVRPSLVGCFTPVHMCQPQHAARTASRPSRRRRSPCRCARRCARGAPPGPGATRPWLLLLCVCVLDPIDLNPSEASSPAPKRRPRSPCAVLPCLGVVARLPAYPPVPRSVASGCGCSSSALWLRTRPRVQTADPVGDRLEDRRRRWAGGPVCIWWDGGIVRSIGKDQKEAGVSANRAFPACGAACACASRRASHRCRREERRERQAEEARDLTVNQKAQPKRGTARDSGGRPRSIRRVRPSQMRCI